MERVEVIFSALRAELLFELNFSEFIKLSYSRVGRKNVHENNRNLSKFVVKIDTLRFIAFEMPSTRTAKVRCCCISHHLAAHAHPILAAHTYLIMTMRMRITF